MQSQTMDSLIAIRNGFKNYGKGKDAQVVLNDFNMTIKKGSIYGFLGASGCGKTTVLSIIVGQLKLDEGSMTVFGGYPGDGKIGIPGKNVGYMPQDLCLFDNLTISETFFYYGRIYSMKDDQIKEKMVALTSFLQLQGYNQCIRNLSGGQKRRVSLGVALIHSPSLLILDEPTVGVDPLLRENIWNHLINLSKIEGKTVIITTHYVKETRQADYIGFMRSGKLLAEGKPDELMQSHDQISMEKLFLDLSMLDDKNKLELHNSSDPAVNNMIVKEDFERESSSELTLNNVMVEGNSQDNLTSKSKPVNNSMLPTRLSCHFVSCSTLKGLITKNLIKLIRNPSILLMMVIFPILWVVAFSLGFAKSPHDIPFGIVNDELKMLQEGCPAFNQDEYLNSTIDWCDSKKISCRLLYHLSKQEAFIFEDYSHIDEVTTALDQGGISGYVHFQANFTEAFFGRFILFFDDDETLNQSTVQVHLAQHDYPVASFMHKSIFEGYLDFLKELLDICDLSEDLADLPLKINNDPRFDSKPEPGILDFQTPGVWINIVFFVGNVLSGDFFIEEILDGTIERSKIAGVQSLEILISYAFTNFGMLVVQSLSVIVLVVYVFQVPLYGSFGMVFLIVFLQGYCGMSCGLMLASVFTDHTMFIYMTLLMIVPMAYLCGMFWTKHAMVSRELRIFSTFLPTTAAVEALRDVLTRGWDVSHTSIQLGIGITLVWIFVFNSTTLVALRLKSK